jgi:long-chain acyl-CoA synthetase
MPSAVQLAGLVRHHARYRPDHTAVVFESERLTWREFAARVARCANVLRGLGVGKGDKVATVLGNCRERLEVYWAVPFMGAVLVPLSPLLTASGLESLLRDSDARFSSRSARSPRRWSPPPRRAASGSLP